MSELYLFFNLWECDEDTCKVNKIYRYMFLTTGQYNEYLMTSYLSVCFYEIHRTRFFSVYELIKNLLISRQNFKLYYEKRELIVRGSKHHCWCGLSTAMKVEDVLALRPNPAFTEVDELSAHGVFLTFLLLALQSLESRQKWKLSRQDMN